MKETLGARIFCAEGWKLSCFGFMVDDDRWVDDMRSGACLASLILLVVIDVGRVAWVSAATIHESSSMMAEQAETLSMSIMLDKQLYRLVVFFDILDRQILRCAWSRG
jgi:hypothetical protein